MKNEKKFEKFEKKFEIENSKSNYRTFTLNRYIYNKINEKRKFKSE